MSIGKFQTGTKGKVRRRFFMFACAIGSQRKMKKDDAKEKCFASREVKKPFSFNFRERDVVNAAVHVVFGKHDSGDRCDFSARILTRFPVL